MKVFVLVGGGSAAGKTTLARALASELRIAYLSKDEVKQALMDRLGAPTSVEESRKLGSAAVAAVLRAARGCSAAVIDSTWYPSRCHSPGRAGLGPSLTDVGSSANLES